MTQKELLYVEDAIGHENCMLHYLNDMIQNLSDKALLTSINKQIKIHEGMLSKLKKLLEDEAQ